MVDYAENVSRGDDAWREPYLAQGEQKRAQIELMIRYAVSQQCRMRSLVRHFGDLADGLRPCGICDFCAPDECGAQRFRAATPREREAFLRILGGLRPGEVRPTGRLYTELYPASELSRDTFEEVLGAMARAGFAQVTEAVFEKDGRQIPFRKVALTRAAAELEGDVPADFLMKEAAVRGKRKGKKKAAAAAKSKRGKAQPEASPDTRLEEALRGWRLNEARKRGVPAFRILTDKAVQAIATARPRTEGELLAVSGIGAATVKKYGAKIYRLVEETGKKA